MAGVRPESIKHVAIFLPNLTGGGAERVALASAHDLVARGHRVDLVLIEAKGDLLPLVPAGVRTVDLRAHRIIASLPALASYLREERPDAVHALMWPVTVVAIMAHRLAHSNARIVVSDHVALSRQMSGGFKRWLLKWTTRLFYPLADERIVVSEAAADDLAALSGIERSRIEVVYNPISPPKRIASNPKIEALWGGKGPRVLTVGALKEQKNHALLLDAFARLSDRDAKLMILGQGHLRGALERRAAELGIADRVIFPGFAVDPWPFYASADLFLLSSDYEGFAIVIAEALYAGLKVVSTDCPAGPREILDGGRFGTLVPVGDAAALAEAMARSLEEPGQPERQRRRAMEVSGPSTLSRYAELLTQ